MPRLGRVLPAVFIATIIVLNTCQMVCAQALPITSSSPAPVTTPAPHRTSAWLYVAGAAALTLLVVAYNAHCKQYPLACSGGGNSCDTSYSDDAVASRIGAAEVRRAPSFGLSFVIR